MKRIIKNILFKLIEFIETIEYRKMHLDEHDITKKFIDEYHTDRYQVLSDSGYIDISSINITQPYRVYTIELENGLKLDCADTHILFNEQMEQVFTNQLNSGDTIQTKFGPSKICRIERQKFRTSMADLSVKSKDMRYYTNDILSHNTICSSIMLLHFVLFNSNKNALVTANKLDTAIEVLDKMKEIYQRLPFFLQKGIVNWNQKLMVFENKSRIKGFATTKTASIGQTADFLYLDEFAYLPDTIAEKFYKSVFPTVANIDNSKIIITSTPNGFNLFHRLLTDAEKPEGEKSNYTAKRVYWWQVPKRHVTYVRLDKNKLHEHDISKEEILEHLRDEFPENESELKWDDELLKWVIHTHNSQDCTEEMIRNQVINDIKLPEIGFITTWKKETIKDIGGEEAFNQEFDLRFINSSRSLLDETLIDEMNSNSDEYSYQHIDEIKDKVKFNVDNLVWNSNQEKYTHELRKQYKVVISVDIAEGLGQDYSVINIFKIKEKPRKIIEKYGHTYNNIVDFYQLEQIGIFRDNLISVKELSELLYLICFEHFDPENVKVVVELNNYGNELLAHMPHVFDGYNDYGSFIFFKYKHRVDSVDEKVGLKVTSNKNLLVKEYQERMASRSIIINSKPTITEMTTFIKHTTTNGNIVYKADGSSHDDQVMTVVNISSIFEKTQFKNIIEDFHDANTSDVKKEIDQILKGFEDRGDSVDYQQLLDIRRRKISYNRRINEARRSWGLDG